MSQNPGSIDLSRLSISEDGPNLTARTPPPPGFDAPSNNNNRTNRASSNTTTNAASGKSTSFNNLAMALGTGLAESMEDSTSEQQQQQQQMHSIQEQQRIPTPSNVDNYTRQSRHSVSRLVGGGSGNNVGGALVGGFEYGHLLVPPLNQGSGGGGFGQSSGGGSGSGQRGMFGGNEDMNETYLGLLSSQQGSGMNQQQQQQKQSQTQQRPVVFTAAMMANAQTNKDAFQLLQNSNNITTNNTNTASSNMNSANINQINTQDVGSNQHILSQELLRHQMWQQSNQSINNSNNNFNPSSNNPIGVTVVEPASSRNSPAPHPTMVGMNGDGLLYPMRASGGGNVSGSGGEHLIGGQLLGSGNVVNNLNNASGGQGVVEREDFVLGGGVHSFAGGRASAPPTNSQQGTAIRAYTASSLQMRFRESHQELGVGGKVVTIGGGANNNNNVPVHAVRTVPAGNVIVLATPTPPPQHLMRPPSREATPDPLLNRQVSRSSTPASTITNSTHQHTFVTSRGPDLQEKERLAVEELASFIRDPPKDSGSSSSSKSASRGLAIVHASSLHVPDVRSTCEAFGALESFRSDFAESKGVFFATFYDLRSAQLAAAELPKALNQMASPSGNGIIEVKYCVPLNSSSATDESMLLLSNLPSSVDEQDLNHLMSSFGEIRAINYQANMSADDDDFATYLVEFYDIQDARQALMELEQTNPWGEDARVNVGSRNPSKRKQGKELIVLMSCWRQGVASKVVATQPPPVSRTPSPKPTQQQEYGSAHTSETTKQNNVAQPNVQMQQGAAAVQQQNYHYHPQHQIELQQQYSTQLVMGPDGQYSYILVPNHPQVAGHHYGYPGQMVIDPHQQQHQHLMYAQVEQQFIHNLHGHMPPQQQYQVQYTPGIPPQPNYGVPMQDNHAPPTQFVRLPSDVNTNAGSLSSGSGQSPARNSQGRMSGSGGSGEDDNTSLALSIEGVRSGTDRRSSLMVRNIPNKYTQQMLLSEFSQAGHGPDKMDFFYLPIDFKNKCNRGYAFVNFVDFKDIIPFFDEYNGKGWKKFNSDKICDITYARIQGKAAMLKRFENSALMEKDDEYRPMVFVSHGEKKGQREAMPIGTTHNR